MLAIDLSVICFVFVLLNGYFEIRVGTYITLNVISAFFVHYQSNAIANNVDVGTR